MLCDKERDLSDLSETTKELQIILYI